MVLLSEIVGKKFIIFKSLTKCIIGADSKIKQEYPKHPTNFDSSWRGYQLVKMALKKL